MHGCSASAPSLYVVRRTPKTSAPRPHSFCYGEDKIYLCAYVISCFLSPSSLYFLFNCTYVGKNLISFDAVFLLSSETDTIKKGTLINQCISKSISPISLIHAYCTFCSVYPRECTILPGWRLNSQVSFNTLYFSNYRSTSGLLSST